MKNKDSIENSIKHVKCVMFDMDGVLYNSMKNHEITWVKCFASVGINFHPREAYINEGSTGSDTIRKVIKREQNREPSKEEIDRIYSFKAAMVKEMGNPPIFPFINELINMLRENNIDVWIVTGSKQDSMIEKLYQDFGVNKSNIISAKDVVQGKPFPEPYLRALAGSLQPVKNCIVVENAPLGVRSAKAAGITTIAVNTGILEDELLLKEGADVVLPDTEALFKMFKKGIGR